MKIVPFHASHRIASRRIGGSESVYAGQDNLFAVNRIKMRFTESYANARPISHAIHGATRTVDSTVIFASLKRSRDSWVS